MEMTMIEPAGPPMPAVTRILSRYDRQQVEAFIEIAVAMLDTLDGDPDEEQETVELNGDELDSTAAEDEMCLGLYPSSLYLSGPGCIYSDPDKGVDDDGEAIDEREADPADFEAPIPIKGGGSGDY